MCHGNRTLYEHLVGVHDLLASWGAPEPLKRAGLFHSIYGTEAFRHVLHNDRDELRTVIGIDAEEMVFLFSQLIRRAFLTAAALGNRRARVVTGVDGCSPLSREQWPSICELYVANALEQAPYSNDSRIAAKQLLCLKNEVSPSAMRAIEAASTE